MSMIRDAIDRLIGLSHARVTDAANDDAMILGPNVHIEDMERFHTYRRRFTGTFETPMIEAFATYCSRHPAGAVFIDPEKMAASCTFDLGDPLAPGHGKHRAVLRLVQTAPMQAWEAICSRRLTQRELREFVADWVEEIADGRHLYSALNTVTVKGFKDATTAVQSFSQKGTALEEYSVNSEQHELPELVRFTCRPYPELEPMTFSARLRAEVVDDKLVFHLVRTMAVQERQDMAEVFKVRLTAAVSRDTYIGTFAL